MKAKLIALIALVMFLIAIVWATAAEEKAKKETKFKYVGVTACKACHSNAKVGGEEYLKYDKDPHKNAYKTLLNEKSKKIAKEKGIDDPTKSEKCMKCHVTAWNKKDLQGEKFSYEEGVTCEACHGAGEKYKAMPIMKDHKKALENGLVVPSEKVCKTCHNPESPTYKPFDFAAKWKLIKHGKAKTK